MFWLKLKAGALQLTLFIAVVIALILAGFILLVHTHKRFNIQTDYIIETSQNTNKGINQALINTIPLGDSINIKNEDNKTLKVHREFWGVFEKIVSVATIKKNKLKRVVLIGAKQPEKNRIALYVQDNNKPLVVVGNTKIEGTVYLSGRGVKPGTISGQSYYGSQLIYGATRRASSLPKLLKETRTQLKSLSNSFVNIGPNQFLTLENGKTFSNSFLKPVQLVYSNSEITLSNINVTGNIVIQSNSKIVVNPTAILKDIILIAPEIDIRDSVKGNFQAIASKNINVSKNVVLEYPSALVLNETDMLQTSVSTKSNIMVNDFSIIRGVILFSSQSKVNNYTSQIEITENAKVIGEVYCTENIELKGSVYGSVFTNNFIAKQSGSIYQNHIYNGTISVSELPEEYVGLSFNNSKKVVLKWLY